MELTGFKKDKIISIDAFSYCRTVNEHEVCEFSISVTDEYLKECTQCLGKVCDVKDDNGFEFSGTVVEIATTNDIFGNFVDVKLKGESMKFDLETKTRVFQNSQKKASDIFNLLNMSGVKYSASVDDCIQEIIVQDNETDWEFSKRLAKYMNLNIFAGSSMWIGESLEEIKTINEDDIAYMKSYLRDNNSQCICRLKKGKEKLNFGSKITCFNKEFFVDKIKYYKEDEEYVFEYNLQEICTKKENIKLPEYLLYGKVTDNNDPDKLGRVKVEFLEPYEDCMKENAVWIECDSIWSSAEYGIACIPSIGDTVIVRISDKVSRICGSRRVEAFGGKFEDVNTKYLLFDDEKYFAANKEKMIIADSEFLCELQKDKLLIKMGDKTNLEINKNSINCNVDKSNVEISGNEISSNVDKSKLKIENNCIKINTDNSNIEISKGVKTVANGFEVDGKSKISMVASKVDIEGKGGVSIN